MGMTNKEAFRREYLRELLTPLGIKLTEQQLQQFALYQEELLSWNEKINLTALTEDKDILIKHFYDSVLGLKVGKWTGQERVLDLGTGAGFPGVPLQIVSPSLSVVLVDSLQKRVKFLQHLLSVLALDGTEAIHGRAEELGREPKLRDKFDIVVSRAVARLAVLTEYCLPFVKPGGVFLAYKGLDGQKECVEADSAIKKLGGKLLKVETFSLPEEMGTRTIISIKKLKPTPAAYPRRPGIPGKNPL
jgi:16S rRNA (guanine527-N7)-methyltransferase